MRSLLVAVLVAILAAGGAVAAVIVTDRASGASTAVAPVDDAFGVTHAVSCASATSCLEVGTDSDPATGESVPVARVLQAGAWRTVPVASPGPRGTSSALTAVSCPTARYCLAVGEYDSTSFGDPFPFALAWNGSALALVSGLNLPPGGYLDALGGVSCPAAGRCVATALATGNGTQTAEPTPTAEGVPTVNPTSAGFDDGDLIWTLNRGRWTLKAVPAPATADLESFGSLYCTTLTSCVAAGRQTMDLSGNTIPAFDTWNGKTLKSLNPPLAPGMTYSGFSGLSCVGRDHCVAVGQGYPDAGGPTTSFIDVWNGRHWSFTPWPSLVPAGNTELTGVSCVTASDCVAVGSATTPVAQQAAALTWDGSTWTAVQVPVPGVPVQAEQPPPSPPASPSASAATPVSAPASSSASASASPSPSPSATPSPLPTVTTSSYFEGVSCAKTGACTAIGEQNNPLLANPAPIFGQWNGSAWQLSRP